MESKLVLFCLFSFGSLTIGTTNGDITKPCQTPNHQSGSCVVISQCQSLLEMIQQKPLIDENKEFVRNSKCGFMGKQPMVCCPNTVKVKTKEFFSELLPNPDKHECGLYSEQRIIGGIVPQLDEIPWLALLEYEKPDGKGFHCGGVLINERYILTAAHCVSSQSLPDNWKLTTVRLGEHDLDTEQDCEHLFDDFCADPVSEIPVEEAIPHENYSPLDKNQYHDIALIRLAKPVVYSEFQKPICLPSSRDQFTGGRPLNHVAGWGFSKDFRNSNVRHNVKTDITNETECNQIYEKLGNRTINDAQICAGGGQYDSCVSDNGGAMVTRVFRTSPNWYANGVMSYGPSPCSMKYPRVYTKVTEYMPWIISKLKP